MGVAREKNVVLEHSSFRHPVRQIVSAHTLPPASHTRRRFEEEADLSIPIMSTRVISVLGLKSTLENPQIQVYFAGNGLLASENGWPFRRFCGGGGGGGGLPAPLLAPRALILRTNQRLDALSRPTPPYFGHP